MKLNAKIQIILLLFLIAVASAFSINLLSVIEGNLSRSAGEGIQRSRENAIASATMRDRLQNQIDEETETEIETETETETETTSTSVDDSSTTSSIQSSTSSQKSLANKIIIESSNEELCQYCKDPVDYNLTSDEVARSKFNCSVDIKASSVNKSDMVYKCNKYMMDEQNSDVMILCKKCDKYSFTIPKTAIESKWYNMMEKRNRDVTSLISKYMDETLGNEISVKQAGDELKTLVSKPLGGHDVKGACGDTGGCHFKEVHQSLYPNQYDLGLLGCALEEHLDSD